LRPPIWELIFAAAMRASLAPKTPELVVRAGEIGDLDALVELENRVFTTDLLSRRSLRNFLKKSPAAALIVADRSGRLAGYALVLFRPPVARLYSIAVMPELAGQGIGLALLAAAEEAAWARGCIVLRLEVHVANARAIARYQKSGFRLLGRHPRYYEDKCDALRFEKRIRPPRMASQRVPPYFHQTTEFTCGAACAMMALAWADPALRPRPALEFDIWREATTIFMPGGFGGCEPYGLALALKRRGLSPEIYVNQPGPYFLDKVHSADKRRVMRLTQDEFHRQAAELAIPSHQTPLEESALMRAFDEGAVAVVLVAGYHMVRRRVPHWVFAFGHDGRHVLVHDPAAKRDEHGQALAAETYAVTWSTFERMTRIGSKNLRAALLIPKGPLQ
jgi:ribosomal protein S18 acetylase RimI-like enzyme